MFLCKAFGTASFSIVLHLCCLCGTLQERFQSRYLRHLHVVIRGLPSIVTGLPLPLVADALDEVLMEVADVEVSHL